MAARNKADSSDVSDDGARVRSRRERLGVDKRHLAETAGVSRETLAAVEKGQGFRRSTLTKIERALTSLEQEAGLGLIEDAAELVAGGSPQTVVIRLGNGAVVVEGPVDNLDALIAAAERLMRASGLSQDDSP